MIKDEEKRDI